MTGNCIVCQMSLVGSVAPGCCAVCWGTAVPVYTTSPRSETTSDWTPLVKWDFALISIMLMKLRRESRSTTIWKETSVISKSYAIKKILKHTRVINKPTYV